MSSTLNFTDKHPRDKHPNDNTSVTPHPTDKQSQILVMPTSHVNDCSFRCRYVFGKPVKGHVTVTFGLIWHGHVFTLGKKRNLEVIIIIMLKTLIFLLLFFSLFVYCTCVRIKAL